MLKEEKSKTRDIEKDGQLFVTARKKLSTNQMPSIAKTLFQKILDEKKNKKRDVKNERRRFVTARETLQEHGIRFMDDNLDSVIHSNGKRRKGARPRQENGIP